MCLIKKLRRDGFFHVYMVPTRSENAWFGGDMDFTSLHDAQSYQRMNSSVYHQYAITWKRRGSPGWLLLERKV